MPVFVENVTILPGTDTHPIGKGNLHNLPICTNIATRVRCLDCFLHCLKQSGLTIPLNCVIPLILCLRKFKKDINIACVHSCTPSVWTNIETMSCFASAIPEFTVACFRYSSIACRDCASGILRNYPNVLGYMRTHCGSNLLSVIWFRFRKHFLIDAPFLETIPADVENVEILPGTSNRQITLSVP